MTQTRLIGINGRLHSGKDSAYDALVKIANPKTVERVGFADKLKMSACAALGIPFHDAADAVRICNDIKEHGRIDIYGPSLYEESENGRSVGPAWQWHLSGREYLQYYGTEAHRDIFGSEFWVDALLPKPYEAPEDYEAMPWANDMKLAERFPGADVVVVTDVRFPNEAERILDLGGEVWLIDAEQRLGPLPPDAHISEHPLAPQYITHIVTNNDTLEQFHHILKAAFNAERVDAYAS